MKLIRKTIPALVILAVILTVAGCSGLLGWVMPLTIEERIAAFTVALNDEDRNPDTILLNFGPEAEMEQYDNAKTESYWEAAFPAKNTYVFAIDDGTDTDAVSVAGAITTESGGTLATTYTFVMYEEDSGNWLINAIYEDPDGTNEMLIRKVDF